MFRSPQNTLPNIFFVQTHTQDGFFDVIVRQGDNQEEELQKPDIETSRQAEEEEEEEEEEEDEDQRQNERILASIAELHKVQRQNERKDEEVKHLKSQLQKMQTNLNDEIKQRKEDNEKFTNYVELAATRDKTFAQYKSDVQAQNSELQQQNATLMSEKTQLQKENQEALELASQIQQELASGLQERRTQEKDLIELSEEKTRLTTQIGLLKSANVKLTADKTKLNSELERETEEKNALKQQHEAIVTRYEQLNNKLINLQSGNEELIKKQKRSYKEVQDAYNELNKRSMQLQHIAQLRQEKIDKLTEHISKIQEEKEAATEAVLRLEQEAERLEHTGDTALKTAIHKIFMIVNVSPTVTLEASYRRQILNICKEARRQSSNQPSPASSDTEHKESQKHPVEKHPVAERPPLNSTPHPKPGALQTPRSGSSDEKDSGPRSDVGASAKELSSTSGAKSAESSGSARSGSEIEEIDERLPSDPSDYDGIASSDEVKSNDSDSEKKKSSDDGSASSKARSEPAILGPLGPVNEVTPIPGQSDNAPFLFT